MGPVDAPVCRGSQETPTTPVDVHGVFQVHGVEGIFIFCTVRDHVQEDPRVGEHHDVMGNHGTQTISFDPNPSEIDDRGQDSPRSAQPDVSTKQPKKQHTKQHTKNPRLEESKEQGAQHVFLFVVHPSTALIPILRPSSTLVPVVRPSTALVLILRPSTALILLSLETDAQRGGE